MGCAWCVRSGFDWYHAGSGQMCRWGRLLVSSSRRGVMSLRRMRKLGHSTLFRSSCSASFLLPACVLESEACASVVAMDHPTPLTAPCNLLPAPIPASPLPCLHSPPPFPLPPSPARNSFPFPAPTTLKRPPGREGKDTGKSGTWHPVEGNAPQTRLYREVSGKNACGEGRKGERGEGGAEGSKVTMGRACFYNGGT